MRSRPMPVSMFFDGSGVRRALFVHVVLHEHEVPVFKEPVAIATRFAVGITAALVLSAVVVEFGARPAGSGGSGRAPEVLAARKSYHAFARDAHLLPVAHGLFVGLDLCIAFEHRDPDLVRVEPESLGGEFVTEPYGALFEVVSH